MGDLLDDAAFRYRLELEARNALNTYIKRRAAVLSLVAGMAGAVATFFGISWHSQVKKLSDDVAFAQNRAIEVQRSLRELKSRTDATLAEMPAKIGVANEMLKQATTAAAETSRTSINFFNAAGQAAARMAELQRDTATDASESKRHAEEIAKTHREVTDFLDQAKNHDQQISEIKNKAEKTDAELQRERTYLGYSLLDLVSLRSGKTSDEILLPDTASGGRPFRLVFRTPKIDPKFTLTYFVDGREEQYEVTDQAKRDWQVLAATGNQYRFHVDFVYAAGGAPDFVTIRVARNVRTAEPPGVRASMPPQ